MHHTKSWMDSDRWLTNKHKIKKGAASLFVCFFLKGTVHQEIKIFHQHEGRRRWLTFYTSGLNYSFQDVRRWEKGIIVLTWLNVSWTDSHDCNVSKYVHLHLKETNHSWEDNNVNILSREDRLRQHCSSSYSPVLSSPPDSWTTIHSLDAETNMKAGRVSDPQVAPTSLKLRAHTCHNKSGCLQYSTLDPPNTEALSGYCSDSVPTHLLPSYLFLSLSPHSIRTAAPTSKFLWLQPWMCRVLCCCCCSPVRKHRQYSPMKTSLRLLLFLGFVPELSVFLSSLYGQRWDAAKSLMAVWEHDPVRSARR